MDANESSQRRARRRTASRTGRRSPTGDLSAQPSVGCDDLYRTLFENSLDAVLVANESGRYIDVNPSACTLTGYTREELLGLSIEDLIAPADRERHRASWPDFVRAGSIRGEFRVLRKDGGLVDVEFSAAVVGPGLYQVVKRDVSVRKRAEGQREEAMSELEATLASIADGLIIFDTEGRIVQMNAAAQSILGYSGERSALPVEERVALLEIEYPDGTRVPPESMPFRRALRGETVRGVEVVLHPPTGRKVWVRVTFAPICLADGRLTGAVVTLTDVTSLHDLEEKRQDLLRAVSHDLRQPLTAILGHAQMLQHFLRADPEQPGKARLTNLDSVIASAQRMRKMIAELVEVSRLEAGELQVDLRPVDLPGIAFELKEHLRASFDTDRVKVEQPVPVPLVLADLEKVERILVNLLSNALHYSPPGTDVVVLVEQREDEVMVSISDWGPGIPSAELPLLFQRYRRASTSRLDSDSLGLGLYITRGLVEAQGGRIWVESEEGVGSTFHFTLPLAAWAKHGDRPD